MPVCACVGASTGPERAGERLAKPRSSTPRRPWPVGCCGQGLTGRAGAAGVRLRGQRLAGCTGAGEEVPAPPGKPRCPDTQPTVPSPRRARSPRLLAPLRRGARGGDGGTGEDGPPAGVSSFQGTGCPQGRGGAGSARTSRQSPECCPLCGPRVVRGQGAARGQGGAEHPCKRGQGHSAQPWLCPPHREASAP